VDVRPPLEIRDPSPRRKDWGMPNAERESTVRSHEDEAAWDATTSKMALWKKSLRRRARTSSWAKYTWPGRVAINETAVYKSELGLKQDDVKTEGQNDTDSCEGKFLIALRAGDHTSSSPKGDEGHRRNVSDIIEDVEDDVVLKDCPIAA
jgi:hypothetical protein